MSSNGLDATAAVSTLGNRKFGATTSASASVYEVFLSFCGEDTRNQFTNFLYTYLVNASLRTFRDEKEIRLGEKIGTELLIVIKESKVLIPILSKYYASSKWCLMELQQMVECHKKWGQKIYPIFYDVDPSDVQNQWGSYEVSFKLLEKKFDRGTVQKWRNALKLVGGLEGLQLKTGFDGFEIKPTEKYWNQNHQAAPAAKKEKQMIGTSSTKRKRESLHIPLEQIEMHHDKTREEAAKALCISDTKLAVVLKDYGFTWTKFKNTMKQKQKSGKAAELDLTTTPHGDDVSNTSWHPRLLSPIQCVKTVVTVVCQVIGRSNTAAGCALKVTMPSLQNCGTNKQFPFQLQNITSPPETDPSDHHNLPMPIQPGNRNHMSLTTIPRGGDVSNTSDHADDISVADYGFLGELELDPLQDFLPELHGLASNTVELVDDLSDHHNLPMPIQHGNANHMSLATTLYGVGVSNTFSLPVLNSSDHYENSTMTDVYQAINWSNSASTYSLANTMSSMQNGGTDCQFPFKPQNIMSPPEQNVDLSKNLHGLASNTVGFVDDLPDHHNLPMWIQPGNANHTSPATIPHGGDVSNTFDLPVLNLSDQYENSTMTAVYGTTNWNNSASAYSLDNTTSSLLNGGTNCQFSVKPMNMIFPPGENVALPYLDSHIDSEYLSNSGIYSPSTNLWHRILSKKGNQSSLISSSNGGGVSNSFSLSVSSAPSRHNMPMSHQAAMQNQFSATPSSLWADVMLTDPTQVNNETNGQLGYQNQNQLLVATPTPETGKPDERHTVTVLAEYGKKTLKFSLSSDSTKDDLDKEVTKRVKLEVGSFYLDYKDEGGRWICIGCDEDLENCIAYVRSLNRTTVEMLVNLND